MNKKLIGMAMVALFVFGCSRLQPKLPTDYWVRVNCTNCLPKWEIPAWYDMEYIRVRFLLGEPVSLKKIKCPRCELVGTLQPYNR